MTLLLNTCILVGHRWKDSSYTGAQAPVFFLPGEAGAIPYSTTDSNQRDLSGKHSNTDLFYLFSQPQLHTATLCRMPSGLSTGTATIFVTDTIDSPRLGHKNTSSSIGRRRFPPLLLLPPPGPTLDRRRRAIIYNYAHHY